jgi:hypothetical protein
VPVRRHQKHDAFDEAARGLDPLSGALARHMRTGSGPKHRLGLIEKLSRFFEEQGSFRLQRSMPSVRISCIKGVRSLYEPAGYGMA